MAERATKKHRNLLDPKNMQGNIQHQPVSAVKWIDVRALRANTYNPNHVFGPERELLKRSILEDGWTQPIVIREDYEIVDGFHRWSLASQDQGVQDMTGGLVPVVILTNKTREQQMAATIRHNRARGKHGVIRMGEIVRTLKGAGFPSERIQEALGMEDEEVERLEEMRPSPELAGLDSFEGCKGWIPSSY